MKRKPAKKLQLYAWWYDGDLPDQLVRKIRLAQAKRPAQRMAWKLRGGGT